MQTISSPYEMLLLMMHEFAAKPSRLREFEDP